MIDVLSYLLALYAALAWRAPTAQVEIVGTAAYYDQGLMETAARNQGHDLAGWAGGVALLPTGDEGRPVWLRFETGPLAGIWQGPFLAVDCASRRRFASLRAQGRAVEVSWETWQANDLPQDLVPVAVRFKPPPLWGAQGSSTSLSDAPRLKEP